MSNFLTFRAKKIKPVGKDTMFELRGGQHYLLPTELVKYENHNTSVYGYLTIPYRLAAEKNIVTTKEGVPA